MYAELSNDGSTMWAKREASKQTHQSVVGELFLALLNLQVPSPYKQRLLMLDWKKA
jgi:hypothetical protein